MAQVSDIILNYAMVNQRGFVPIFIAIFAVVTATSINMCLDWWRAHLLVSVRGALAKLWPLSVILFVVVFLIGVEIAIFGYPCCGSIMQLRSVFKMNQLL